MRAHVVSYMNECLEAGYPRVVEATMRNRRPMADHLYRQGMSVRQVSKALDITEPTIRKWLDRSGAKPIRRK